MLKTRKYTIIVMLALIVALCLTFASCDVIKDFFHEHNYGDDWYYNATDHWQECEDCGKVGKKAKHTVDENSWIVTVQPTETQVGTRKGKCSVCDADVTENVPKLDHQHVFSGEYLSDELGHWKKCASCDETGEFGEHEVTNWVIDRDSTATTQGQKHGSCDVCHTRVDAVIPIVGHTHNYSNTLSYDDTYHYYECSCGDKTEVNPHTYPATWQSDNTKHWKVCECGRIDSEQEHITQWITDTPATTTSAGLKHEECIVCNKKLGSATIPQLTSTTRTVDLYAINDFHGTVDKISSVGGYLKQQKNSNANTVLINSGDMFQGSMESNSNYGKLLTDCMDAIGFDAFTFGNHEFDWGLSKLESLAQNSNVPFLGANIYHWNASSKTWGTFAEELAQKYIVTTLDNGLKVGIIGVIGQDQITSISSNLVQTIGFKEPLPIIKELATELRKEQKCDIVVVSAHTGPQSLVGETENNQKPSTAGGLQEYVDAVFCAHTHRAQVYEVDGLPFIQGGSYGSNVSHVTLSVSSSGKVACTQKQNVSYSNSWPNITVVDNLIDNSNAQIEDERNQVVINNLSSSLNKNPAMARLVSRAIAEYAKNQNYDIALAMVNTARNDLPKGIVTYSNLYESIPFDNVVYIAKVKGSEIISEVNYGNYYWRSSGEAIESNKYYYIAVIDYLLFHQNSNRNYNYFPSAFTSGFTPVALANTNYEVYNYRLITRDYLLANNINASDYINDNNNTDTSLLQNSVTLTYETSGNWNASGGTKPNPTPTPNPEPTPSGTSHAGTLADPYTVADALKVAADYSSNTNAGNGYVVGKVSISGSNLKRGSSSDDLGGIYLVDDSGNKILIYYLSKFSGATQGNNWDWTGVESGSLPNELKAGDTIVIYAKTLFTFNSNTPEVGSSYCISINGVDV